MKRLFQHYEGNINALEGLKLMGLKSLTDEEAQNDVIVLFWLKTEDKWLRIFIDGWYCGVDAYAMDTSKDDLDEGVFLVNKDHWVKDLVIKKATVTSGHLPLITLIIEFTNGTFLVLNCDEDVGCRLMKF